MKLLVVETEEAIVDAIKKIIARHFHDIEIIGIAHNIKEASMICFKTKPEILIIDVTLGNILSFELFEYIDATEYAIIFLSAYKDFTKDADKFNGVDYLIKPFDDTELIQGIQKAKEYFKTRNPGKANQQPDLHTNYESSTNKDTVFLSENHIKIPIKTISIVKICSDGSYSKVYFTSGKHKDLSRNLKFYEILLIGHGFIRTHKTCLVNQIYIEKYLSGQNPKILLADGSKEPLSRTKRKEIIYLLAQKFMGNN